MLAVRREKETGHTLSVLVFYSLVKINITKYKDKNNNNIDANQVQNCKYLTSNESHKQKMDVKNLLLTMFISGSGYL